MVGKVPAGVDPAGAFGLWAVASKLLTNICRLLSDKRQHITLNIYKLVAGRQESGKVGNGITVHSPPQRSYLTPLEPAGGRQQSK